MLFKKKKKVVEEVREESEKGIPTSESFQLNNTLNAETVCEQSSGFGKRSNRGIDESKEEMDPTTFVEPQVISENDEQDVAPAVIELQEQEAKKAQEEKEDENAEIFYEKKRFLASQYEKAQNYLEKQSQDGYHFIGKKGKRFYFKEGKPTNYYYSYCYFKYEPEASDWATWERDGWKLISQNAGRNRKDAGWYILRNQRELTDYKKEIDNDDEKFGLFKRLSNSYRSTLFMFFVIMAVCLVTAYLQYEFNGFLITLAMCAFIFVLSFIFFLIYCRYLWNAQKAKRKLKTKLRIKEKEEFIRAQNVPDYTKTEEELKDKWDKSNK